MSRLKMCTFPAAVALFLIVSASQAFSAGAESSVESMKKGKAAVEAQCLGCHDTVSEAAAGYRRLAEWEVLVKDMVGRGAKLDEAQQGDVIQYLSGRGRLYGKCGACHTVTRSMTQNRSFDDWKSLVERMAKKMPRFYTPEDIEVISQFLAAERPAK